MYKPNPSAEIIYGLVPDGVSSSSLPQEEKGIWRIYPNGTVVLRNSGTIDREVRILIIARAFNFI